MPETVNAVAFGILATLIVGGAVMMLFSRNVVHAAFWLLETMLATAGLFLLLSAEFLALVQILVYAGAVGVLILFVVMLTLRRREDAVRPLDLSVGAAGLAATLLVSVFVAIAAKSPATASMPEQTPGALEFGTELFTRWVVPFEIASLVLLVALVGAVWWSGGGDE
jgi:NADH-quinone oxidoreductase subunit J